MHYDKVVVPKEINEAISNTILLKSKKMSEGIQSYTQENMQNIVLAKVGLGEYAIARKRAKGASSSTTRQHKKRSRRVQAS
jgi:hypothetical protein